MKAIKCTKYGPPEVLKLRIINKPTPKDNELLVKIHTTTVTAGDRNKRGGIATLLYWLPVRMMFGFIKPRNKILGWEFSGEIEAVGNNTSLYRVGDQVFGTSGLHFSCYAEYVCIPEKCTMALKPVSVSYEEAAAVPIGASTALHFLRKANIQPNQKILIYGASGSVGTYAIQLAKYFGADVTGVCSTTNLEMVKSIGADRVIDYTKEKYFESNEKYDFILDTVGKSSFSGSLKSLKKTGTYLISAVWKMSWYVRILWNTKIRGRKIISGVASDSPEELKFLKQLLEIGKIKPVIDKQYPLENIVEAHEYADKGHKKGNVVISVV